MIIPPHCCRAMDTCFSRSCRSALSIFRSRPPGGAAGFCRPQGGESGPVKRPHRAWRRAACRRASGQGQFRHPDRWRNFPRITGLTYRNSFCPFYRSKLAFRWTRASLWEIAMFMGFVRDSIQRIPRKWRGFSVLPKRVCSMSTDAAGRQGELGRVFRVFAVGKDRASMPRSDWAHIPSLAIYANKVSPSCVGRDPRRALQIVLGASCCAALGGAPRFL